MAIPDDTLKNLVRNACLSADVVAVGFQGTNAEKTRAILTRALEALEANGLIRVTPIEEWPHFYFLDPPYSAAGFEIQGDWESSQSSDVNVNI